MEKFDRKELEKKSVQDLRAILRDLEGTPGSGNKKSLIEEIVGIQSGDITPTRDSRGRKPNGPPVLRFSEPEDEPVKEESSEEPAISGVLDIHADGYGFLRKLDYKIGSNDDVFVPPNTIRYFRLKKGDFIEGKAGKIRERGSAALTNLVSINGNPPAAVRRVDFDDLSPHYPDERLTLEIVGTDDLSIRCMDLFCPIGKGQRGLIVAPPKAGKTTLLKKIANSVKINHKDVKLITLLIDERPEEVTDIMESIGGEVVSSTFDDAPDSHVRVAELVLCRAKRLVETGKDVVILLDSLTRLSRAYNSITPSSGKTLSGGLDPAALQGPKKFFGAARNIRGGGSLTIVSTVLIDTGSKMDEVIYEEFKGTGNMELHLSSELSEKRIFPAIDLYKSGTRKEELLLSEEELDCAYKVRRLLSENRYASANLLDMMAKTKSNAEFVEKLPAWLKIAGRG